MKNSKNSIDACVECMISCEGCITDSIKTGNQQCILLCRDCADICALTARFEARGSLYGQALYDMCAEICNACAEECEKHSAHASCKICAEACRKCAEICEELATAMRN